VPLGFAAASALGYATRFDCQSPVLLQFLVPPNSFDSFDALNFFNSDIFNS